MAGAHRRGMLQMEADVGSLKRTLLLAVAALLCLTAALAIGILLIGRMGPTEGRILGTTAILAGCGLVAVPGTMLLDQARRQRWAAANLAIVAAAAGAMIGSIWFGGDSETFGKTVGTLTMFALATTQVSALQVRRRDGDPPVVRRLFVFSSVLVLGLAATVSVMVWVEAGGGFGRFVGALVILDLLCVALQPILARVRSTGQVYELTVVLASGETHRLSLEAADLGGAVAKAIRRIEREGGSVVGVETRDRVS